MYLYKKVIIVLTADRQTTKITPMQSTTLSGV